MSNQPRHILIVDDELESLQAHIDQAKQAGFDVSLMRSTDEAIHEFLRGDTRRFDVIVLDMMIPPPEENPDSIDVWDGLRSGGHLLAILRDRDDQVPVLLLSNLAEDEIELEAWDRFEDWRSQHGHPMPDARNSEMVREMLRQHFRTWIRAKRRTPPWHFPKVLEEMLSCLKASL